MQNEKTGTGGSRCRFCLWYGLLAECEENYVNIHCTKKLRFLAKLKLKPQLFCLVLIKEMQSQKSKSRLQGGTPTASPAQCITVESKEIPYPAKKSRRKV